MVTKTVTARLRKDLSDEIERIAREESLDRSSTIQKLLGIGVREYRIKKALGLYRDGKVTLWRAAEIAGTSLREMMDLLESHDIHYQYDMESLEEHVESLITKSKK